MKQRLDTDIPILEGKLISNYTDSSDDHQLLANNFIKRNKKITENSQFLKFNTNIISMFFVLYLTIFAVISIKYVPNFYSVSNRIELYNAKTRIKYFSEFFSSQPICKVKLNSNLVSFEFISNFIVYNRL